VWKRGARTGRRPRLVSRKTPVPSHLLQLGLMPYRRLGEDSYLRAARPPRAAFEPPRPRVYEHARSQPLEEGVGPTLGGGGGGAAEVSSADS
jgi:hypothetical protein